MADDASILEAATRPEIDRGGPPEEPHRLFPGRGRGNSTAWVSVGDHQRRSRPVPVEARRCVTPDPESVCEDAFEGTHRACSARVDALPRSLGDHLISDRRRPDSGRADPCAADSSQASADSSLNLPDSSLPVPDSSFSRFWLWCIRDERVCIAIGGLSLPNIRQLVAVGRTLMSRVTLPKASVALLAALIALSWLMSPGGDCRAQQPLGFNNVVVFQSGDGSSSLSTTTNKALLKEFTPGGSLVQTFEMPSSGAGTRLVIQGNSSAEGMLSISPDGRWIAFGGYDSGTGVSGVTSSTTVPRVAGILNTTTGTYSLTPMGSGFRASTATAIRGAATNDGNNIWAIGGGQGLVYGTVAGGTGSFGTISSVAATNYNAIGVYSGTSTNLYASSSQSGQPTVGTFGPDPLPTGTATTFAAAPNVPNSAAGNLRSGFVYLDVNPSIPGLDTLYVANSISNSDGILKYSLDLTGTWVSKGSILSSGLTLRGLSGFVSGTSVRLFTTTTGTLFSFWDADAMSSSLSGSATTLLTSIATAPAGTAFRGVVVVPEPSTVTLLGAGLAGIGGMEWVRRRRSRRRRWTK